MHDLCTNPRFMLKLHICGKITNKLPRNNVKLATRGGEIIMEMREETRRYRAPLREREKRESINTLLERRE